MVLEVLFWLSLGTLVYVFFGFVVVLWICSKFKDKPVQKGAATPSVSIIICAYNEARHIRQKIANCLDFDYPRDQTEIIIVSDGSTDDTDKILASLQGALIKTYRMPQQRGKTECQNLAAEIANNQILFFTDATVMHPPNALKLLVRSLCDSSVGCVTGKPVFNRDMGPASMGLSKREKYEFYLRSKLGEVSSLFGAQDCIYVIPRGLYRPVRADLDSGFVAPLQLLERGYRTVYEPEALAFVDRPAPSIKDELTRRSRICLRGLRGLLYMRHLMNPFKYGFVALSLISARLLRWLTPLFLVVLLIANLFLISSPLYVLTLLLQVAFYITAVVAFLVALRGYQLSLPFYLPLYFCVLVCSASVGLKRLLAGETGQTWQTRR
jgi:cellulose synthase/poly-beta-1,6-N-acetylglucosamine synthase-like glycosyltransferase